MEASVRTPVHLWIVGAIALLWNAFGCYDYVMTQTNNAEYLASMGMTETQRAYYETFPMWLEGVLGGRASGVRWLGRGAAASCAAAGRGFSRFCAFPARPGAQHASTSLV